MPPPGIFSVEEAMRVGSDCIAFKALQPRVWHFGEVDRRRRDMGKNKDGPLEGKDFSAIYPEMVQEYTVLWMG